MRNDTLPLTIYFSRFDTEPTYDNLTIFDLGSGLPIDTISGHYDQASPPDSVTAPSGKMFLIFSTNSSITGKGWEIYYPKKKNTGIAENSVQNKVSVYPNPARDFLFVSTLSGLSGELQLEMNDIRGLQILNFRLAAGTKTSKIDVSALKSGMYFLRITSGCGSVVKKVVID